MRKEISTLKERIKELEIKQDTENKKENENIQKVRANTSKKQSREIDLPDGWNDDEDELNYSHQGSPVRFIEDESQWQYLKHKENKRELTQSNNYDKLNSINKIRNVKSNINSNSNRSNKSSYNDLSDEYRLQYLEQSIDNSELVRSKRDGSLYSNREIESERSIKNYMYNSDRNARFRMGLEWPALPRRLPKERTNERKDIKIIEDTQLVPPRGSERRIETKNDRIQEEEETWRMVENREMKRSTRIATKVKEREETVIRGIRRRPPRSAAISIMGVREDFSYADALRKVKNDSEMTPK